MFELEDAVEYVLYKLEPRRARADKVIEFSSKITEQIMLSADDLTFNEAFLALLMVVRFLYDLSEIEPSKGSLILIRARRILGFLERGSLEGINEEKVRETLIKMNNLFLKLKIKEVLVALAHMLNFIGENFEEFMEGREDGR